MKRNVAILIFEQVEVLDFAGPFEIFSVSSELNDHQLFNVFTVGKTSGSISAVNGLSVNPAYAFAAVPRIDILLLPGGIGTRALLEDEEVLRWVASIHQHTELTLSVCSGARILGKLGLLDRQPYCTHQDVYEHMQQLVSTGMPQKDKRFVNSGRIYTSAGISAGMDLSLYIVEKLYGKAVAEQTAAYMEYHPGSY